MKTGRTPRQQLDAKLVELADTKASLKDCLSEITQPVQKQKAYAELQQTARQLRYWETTQNTAGTAAKFIAGEIVTRIGGGLAKTVADEVLDEVAPKVKEAGVFQAKLNEFGERLHLVPAPDALAPQLF